HSVECGISCTSVKPRFVFWSDGTRQRRVNRRVELRTQQQLLHSRTRVRPRYALMPLEGFPTSRLPQWTNTDARILAAPALGAQFVEYLLNLQPGGGVEGLGDTRTEVFFYMLSGAADLTIGAAGPHSLVEGSFALIPARMSCTLRASAPTSILMLRKAYEPLL